MEKKSIRIFSKNDDVNQVIENLKNNNKIYNKLISALNLLGEFDNKVEVEIYDTIVEDDKKKIQLCCSDLNDNFYIFYGESFDKTDLLKITKNTSEEELQYDLSLSKKYELNKDNIEFTRSDKVIDFKFGRIITDGRLFYSLFLQDDIGYQIQSDFSDTIINELLDRLNKLDKSPTLNQYLNIINEVINEKQIVFKSIKVSIFNKFERIDYVVIENKKVRKKLYTNDNW